MGKNKKILIAAIVIIIVAIIGCLYFFGVIDSSSEGKTPFDNNFISGDFVGTVNKITIEDWIASYKDPVNHIEYNMSTYKNASYLADSYKLQGMNGPEERKYNDQIWSIYSGEGIVNGVNETGNKTVYCFLCVADKDNQSYVVIVVFNDIAKVNVSDNVYCPGFVDFVEPLLTSATLKHNDNAPNLYEILGIDQNTFNQQAKLFHEVTKGNMTALSQLQG